MKPNDMNAPIDESLQEMEEPRGSLLFIELARQPETQPPHRFAAGVTAFLRKKADRKERRLTYFLVGLLTLITLFVAGTIIRPENIAGLGAVLSRYRWPFLFSLFCLFMIQLLDRKWVKH